VFEIRHYVAASGKDVLGDWLDGLKDKRAWARINKRIERLAVGNFGDCKPLREGVSELRIDYGPGYRIYFGRIGRSVILLLCGGDKRKQSADIARAIVMLKDYERRTP
jgi:putative addiction module killer protein